MKHARRKESVTEGQSLSRTDVTHGPSSRGNDQDPTPLTDTDGGASNQAIHNRQIGVQ